MARPDLRGRPSNRPAGRVGRISTCDCGGAITKAGGGSQQIESRCGGVAVAAAGGGGGMIGPSGGSGSVDGRRQHLWSRRDDGGIDETVRL